MPAGCKVSLGVPVSETVANQKIEDESCGMIEEGRATNLALLYGEALIALAFFLS